METWAATLLAAVCGLMGALAGTRISYIASQRAAQVAKENANRADQTTRAIKLSDHRVAWIQRLRDEMAVFQSWGMTPGIRQSDCREFYEHGTRIELLMNPSDPDYERLHHLMYALLHAENVSDKYSVNAEFIETCQRILKREWDVAKTEISIPLI